MLKHKTKSCLPACQVGSWWWRTREASFTPPTSQHNLQSLIVKDTETASHTETASQELSREATRKLHIKKPLMAPCLAGKGSSVVVPCFCSLSASRPECTGQPKRWCDRSRSSHKQASHRQTSSTAKALIDKRRRAAHRTNDTKSTCSA